MIRPTAKWDFQHNELDCDCLDELASQMAPWNQGLTFQSWNVGKRHLNEKATVKLCNCLMYRFIPAISFTLCENCRIHIHYTMGKLSLEYFITHSYLPF